MPEIHIIAALGRNRVIGNQNKLCWHLPEDFARFRALTRSRPVIMGRLTWESLPEVFRPLPGRQNIVVSRQEQYAAVGAETARTLGEALQLAQGERVYVIGGEQLYTLALPHADVLELTEVDLSPDGDTHFPEVAATDWLVEEVGAGVSQAGVGYKFQRYTRSHAVRTPTQAAPNLTLHAWYCPALGTYRRAGAASTVSPHESAQAHLLTRFEWVPLYAGASGMLPDGWVLRSYYSPAEDSFYASHRTMPGKTASQVDLVELYAPPGWPGNEQAAHVPPAK